MTISYPHPYTLEDHFAIAMGKELDSPIMFMPTLPERDGGMYLQLGTGYKEINSGNGYDWLNWDFPDWDADDGSPIPLAEEEVDGVICYHSMDHFAEPIRILAEIQRVLKPGGWFVCVVPHYASELWNSDLTHVGRFATDTWRNIFSERHYKHTSTVPGHTRWKFRIQFNMIMAITERNTVLVTQLIKES